MSDLVGDVWKFTDNPINFEGRDVTGDSAPPVLVGAGYSVGSSIAPGSTQRLRVGDKFLVVNRICFIEITHLITKC